MYNNRDNNNPVPQMYVVNKIRGLLIGIIMNNIKVTNINENKLYLYLNNKHKHTTYHIYLVCGSKIEGKIKCNNNI